MVAVDIVVLLILFVIAAAAGNNGATVGCGFIAIIYLAVRQAVSASGARKRTDSLTSSVNDLIALRDRLLADIARMTQRIYKLEQAMKAGVPATAAEPEPVVVAPPAPAPTPSALTPAAVLPKPVAPVPTPAPTPVTAPPKPVPVITPPVAAPTPAAAQPAMARVAAPAPPAMTAPARPAPPIVPPPPPPPRKPFSVRVEDALGTNWLTKIGIVFLVIGGALFLAWEFGGTPQGKIILGYLASVGLLGGGIYGERQERYKVFSRSLIGGGWALTFATTYAMYFFPPARVMSSERLDLVLLFLVAAAMVVHTLRYNSQWVTAAAFLLGFTTVALSHVDVFSLWAGAILAIGLVVIVLRRQWYELEVFGILASFLNHWAWLVPLVERMHETHQEFAMYVPSMVLLGFYWATFRFSYLARKIETTHHENVSSVAAILNSFLLLAVVKFQSAHPEYAFAGLLILGSVEFILGQLPVARKRRPAFIILSTIGATLIATAFPMRITKPFSDVQLTLVWTALAEAFFIAGVFLKEKVFRWLGIVATLLVAIQAARTYFTLPEHTWASSALFFTVAVAMFLNAEFFRRTWLEISSHNEGGSLRCMSYVGGLMLGVGLWIALSHTWIAIAWAGAALAFTLLAVQLDGDDLGRQGYLFSLAALIALGAFNFEAGTPEERMHRLIAFGVTALLFYVIATQWNRTESEGGEALRIIHNCAATLLVGAAIYFRLEKTLDWVAVAWTILLLLLCQTARWTKWREFAGLAVALVLPVAGFALFVNMPNDASFHGLGATRIWTVVPVVLGLYGGSRLVHVEEWAFTAEVMPFFTWTATAVADVFLWYQLSVPTRALAWAVFGVVLFEWGIARKAVHSRVQGYLNLAGAFGYMFVGNLGADLTRSYMAASVLPLAGIFYYVHTRLDSLEQAEEHGKARVVGQLQAYMGTIAVASLLFAVLQTQRENVVIAWAALVVVLFGVGWATRKAIWQEQGVLMAIVVGFRGAFLNLAERSPQFTDTRLKTIGLTVALLLVGLGFAMAMKRTGVTAKKSWLRGLATRPEQALFFVPVALVAALIFISQRSGMITLSLGIEGAIVFTFALWLKERSFRLTGLFIMLFCVAKVAAYDLWFVLTGGDRWLTLFGLGVALVTVGFLYSRYRERIRELL